MQESKSFLVLFFKKELLSSLADDLFRLKEERDLSGRILRTIRPVHGIGLDILGELGPYRARVGLLRVGGAHDAAVGSNGVLALQHLQHDGAGGHEADQAGEEGAGFMHAVKFLGLFAGHEHALLGDDAQAGGLELGVDGAGQVAPGRVRLDDRKCLFQGHDAQSPLAAP